MSRLRDAGRASVVMDRGAIVEQGSQEELLAGRGRYFELYESQIKEPLAEAV